MPPGAWWCGRLCYLFEKQRRLFPQSRHAVKTGTTSGCTRRLREASLSVRRITVPSVGASQKLSPQVSQVERPVALTLRLFIWGGCWVSFGLAWLKKKRAHSAKVQLRLRSRSHGSVLAEPTSDPLSPPLSAPLPPPFSPPLTCAPCPKNKHLRK